MTAKIDWRNSLTKGLFRANIPSGPYSVNLVSGRISAPAAGTYSTGVSRVGEVQYGSESVPQTSLTVYATDNLFKTHVVNVFTMAGLVYLPNNYASPTMVFGEGQALSGSNISMVRTSNFTHAWEARLRASFAGPIFSTTTDAVDAVAGGIYLIVASMNRNAPTDKGLLDVYRLDTGAHERVTSTDDIGTDFNGYDSFSFGLGDVAGLALQLTWNRELTKAERDSLAAQPWQIFKGQPIIGAHELPTDMQLITSKKPWTSAPPLGTPIDDTHSIGKKIVAHSFFNGKNFQHGVRGGKFKVTGAESGSGIDVARINSKGDFYTKPVHITSSPRDYFNAIVDSPIVDIVGKPFSVFMAITNETGTLWNENNYPLLFLGGTPGGVEVWWDWNSTTQCNFFVRLRATSWLRAEISYLADPSTYAEGEALYFGLTYDSGGFRAYMNGEDITGSCTIYDDLIAGDYGKVPFNIPPTMDVMYNISNWSVTPPYSNVYAISGSLTAAEHKALADNPWQVFEPEIVHAPFNEELPELVKFEKPWESQPL